MGGRRSVAVVAVLTVGIGFMPAGTAFAGKPSGGGGGGSNQTAQGIMVNLDASGTFTVVDNQQYKFNETTAAGYFGNDLTSGPTVSCTGSPTNCASTNQPSTPTTPAANPQKVNGTPQAPGAVQDNMCTFLNGGDLTGSTYTQSTTVPGLNGGGNWKFTWTYTVTPSPTTVDPFTAWDLNKEVTGSASIDVNADIAGESVLVKNGGSWKKYSFSMLESDLSNRVTGLTLTVKDGSSTVVETDYPNSTVNSPVDFAYATNAGSNGSTLKLQDGDARTILNNDSFAGNNNGGADGSALALATMDTVSPTLDIGSYSITLTGTVKGNSIDATSTGANISFSVTSHVQIIAPGCGAQSV